MIYLSADNLLSLHHAATKCNCRAVDVYVTVHVAKCLVLINLIIVLPILSP